MSKKISKINIELPQEEHIKLKIIAAITETSIKDLVLSAVRDKIRLEINKHPNSETLKSFQETDSGIGVTKHQDLTSLMKDLGLDNDQIN